MCVLLLSEHLLTQADVKIQPVVTRYKLLYISLSGPVRAGKVGLAKRVRPARPASPTHSPNSGRIWCLLTGFLPSHGGVIWVFLLLVDGNIT